MTALSIPEPTGEVAGGEQQPELEPGRYVCCQCERVGKLDHLLEFQRMLGTCDEDACLEARVKELLDCEERDQQLKWRKR